MLEKKKETGLMPLDCPLACRSNVGIINVSSGDYIMASVLHELSFS